MITKKVSVYYAFRDKLREIFGSDIQLASNHFPPVNMNDIDLILSSGSRELEAEFVEGRNDDPPLLTANRSIDFSKLEKLLELPSGVHCLLVSNESQIAKDSVEFLERMGFDHLYFTPYSPDMSPLPPLEGIEIAITHGLSELVPAEFKRIIDLGDRSLDLSTIFEISRILQVSVDKAHLFTADFFRNFVRLGKKLAYSIENERHLNEHLETVLNAVHEGVIWVDQKGIITVFNQEAGSILGVKCENAIRRHHSEVIGNFNVDDVFKTMKEFPRQIIQMQGLQILITKTPIMLDDSFLGAVITFQDVTHVQRLEQEIRKKKKESGLTTKYSFEDVIGCSVAIEHTKEIAEKIARSDYTILISGESGTGKEVFAQAIHNYSSRIDGPFLAVNFAGLTQSLAESELFGYEEGAFTGARRGGKTGLFELAQNGTIFLDEIGDAPPSIQAALLRVLQERQVMRVGGRKVIPINVRIIAATNKDLYQMIKEGTFREDLFYRLNQLPLDIPPLRKRGEDIEVLMYHFLRERNSVLVLTPEFVEAITKYEWPGNIRELVAFINYLTVTVDGNRVGVEHLPPRIKQKNTEELNKVDSTISYLKNQGDLHLFMQILECLSLYQNQKSGLGRGSLLSVLDLSVSEGQLRSKLDTLRRCGCVHSGVKKQGTKITNFGSEVLKKLKL
ncbi:sigma-54 interaction domain-containing protein [Pseudalkalibacillus decolorationis]|uniref:sigma-54 interaction domain-containing protein n=1 Tax=Pseudalkalibacillus decolorationis TaxID=163879 RepID=UPI00214851D9|nr:sigma 54-interacting transcriptional regulator [Pseudalkalibacillus decolorationis]